MDGQYIANHSYIIHPSWHSYGCGFTPLLAGPNYLQLPDLNSIPLKFERDSKCFQKLIHHLENMLMKPTRCPRVTWRLTLIAETQSISAGTPHSCIFQAHVLEPRNSLTLKLISKVQTTENPLFKKRKWLIVLTWVFLQFFDIKILWNFSKDLSELA